MTQAGSIYTDLRGSGRPVAAKHEILFSLANLHATLRQIRKQGVESPV